MHLIHEYGLVAVAAIIGLECLGLPVPGETALLGAAIYAGTKHDFNINAVIVAAAVAAIAGRMIGYVIGHKFGSWLLLRYGRYVGLTTGRIKLGQYLFLRYGGKIVFFAQFVPVLRTLAGPFAGANLMPWRNFIFANVVSSCVWAVSYGYAAYWVGGSEQSWCHRETERSRCLEINDQLELARLLDRKVGGLLALEDAIDIGCGAAE